MNSVRQRAPGDQAGQILVMYLIFLIPLSVVVLSVFNVGSLVAEKMRLQNAADSAAYSAAVWEARYANLVAYTNRAMIANYDTIATQVALWSMADAWDGFTATARNHLVALNSPKDFEMLHMTFHRWNLALGKKTVGRSGNRQVNPNRDGAARLENYNEVLSYTQAALYLLTQVAREFVIRDIARSADPAIEYSLFAEGLNAKGLHSRVQWSGTDEKQGLRLTLERSLNKLARGGGFRDAPDVITARANVPLLATECGPVKVSQKGFDGPGFDRETGKPGEEGEVEIVRNGQLYQRDRVNSVMTTDLPGCPPPNKRQVQLGHYSDDAFNKTAQSRRDVPHVFDGRLPYHHLLFKDDKLQCSEEPGETVDEAKPPCATRYKWITALANMRVTTFVPDNRVAAGNEVAGPTVLVVLRKKAERLPLLHGLGLTDKEDVEAYSLAKVYYAQRPGETQEKESFFNPFWTARLESFRPAGIRLLH